MGLSSHWYFTSILALSLMVAIVVNPWLSAGQDRPVVKLTTLDWPPYSSPSLPEGGYACKAVRGAMAKAGYAVEIEFLPWNRAVDAVTHGEADGYFPEYPTDTDPGKYLYAGPIPAAPLVFAGMKGKTYRWPPLDGLKGSVIGVVRGFRNTQEFDSRKDLDKDFSDSDRQNLEKLLAGRTDLIVIDKAVCSFLLHDMGDASRNRVVSLQPVLEKKNLVVVFGQNNPWSPELAREMNKAFQEMAASGELDRLAAEAGIAGTRP